MPSEVPTNTRGSLAFSTGALSQTSAVANCPELQNGGRQHLGFGTMFAISLLFDRSSSNVVKTLDLENIYHTENTKLPKFKMTDAT